MKIDFTDIRHILAHIERLLAEHQNDEIHTGRIGALRRSDTLTASLLSDLVAVQDCLRLADAEVCALYWQCEGRPDPRLPIAPRWQSGGSMHPDTNRRGGTSPAHSVGRIKRLSQPPRTSLPH